MVNLGHEIYYLNEILIYLKANEIEAVHLIKDNNSPIQISQKGKRIKIQKKHLKKLSTKLKYLVAFLKSSLKDVRTLPITTPMRKHLKDFYEEILKIYSWYAELFKVESKKKHI